MKNSIKLSVILLLLVLTACTNDDEMSPAEKVKADLLGGWEWIESTGSIAGVTVSPETQDKRMRISFLKNSTFKKYVDGVEVYSSPYELSIDNDVVKIKFTTLAQFESIGFGLDHQTEQEIEFNELKSTIVMKDPCCDLFTFKFSKLFPTEPF